MAEAATTGDTESDPRCRACLLKASPMAPNVFEPWNNGSSTIAIDLAKLTGVMILETDPYSKKMCHTCCSKLHSACAFVAMVQDSDCELKKLCTDTGECWPKPIQVDKNVNEAVFGNVQDVEIKQEVLSDDDNFDANGADDYNPDMDIKIEPEEITQPTPIKITVNVEGGHITLRDKPYLSPQNRIKPPRKSFMIGSYDDAKDSGEQVVTILDDENDPLKINKTNKHSNKIRLVKKRKITKENSPAFDVLDSSDDDQFVKSVKTEHKVYKPKRIINESRVDYGGRKKTLKTQNKSVSEMPMNLEDESELSQNTCTFDARPKRKTALNKITSKTLQECTKMKNHADVEFKCDDPIFGLILEVEDEQPTIEAIAKKIAINLKTKPKKNLSKAEKIRRYLKCCGKAYRKKSGILVSPKSLGPPCWCGTNETYCKQLALTQEQRQYIFKTYWGFADSNKQFAFIVKFTTKCNKKLPCNTGKGLINRDFVYRYYLPVSEDLDGEKVRVCRKMFCNTLSTNLSISRIWRKYENTCDLKGKNIKDKRDHDKVASVCEHFRILRESKLTLLKQKAAGLYTKRIETFGIKKMFSQYQAWLDRDKYSDEPRTWPEYEQILARNIPQDHIRTLQQGDRQMNLKTNEKGDGKICIEIENITRLNSETKVVFRPDDDFVEECDSESVHSNFSDELQQIKIEIETDAVTDSEVSGSDDNGVREQKECEENDGNGKTSKSDTTLRRIKNAMKTRKSIHGRKSLDQKSEVAESAEEVNYKLGHIIGESLGRQFLTTRGKLIILRPPCACKLKCFDKITEQQREFIFSHFWRLGKRSNQWSFVLQFTSRTKPKSVARAHLATSPHKYRFIYFLPLTENIGKDAETVQVCQTMFTQTLVISGKVVMDSWARVSGDMKAKGRTWTNAKAPNEEDINDVTERKNDETNNFNVQDYTLRKEIAGKSIDEIELDNTQLDFVYRALPWDEYLNAVSAKVAKEEAILDSSTESHQEDIGVKNTKRKRCRNKRGKFVEKSLGSPCHCFRKCSEKIDEEQRMFIFNFYRSLDGVAQQWAFLVRFSERCVPERHSTDPSFRRQYSFKFFLPVSKDLDGEKVQVCKVMMCNTLAISNTVCRAWRYFSKGKLIDKRGKSKNKISVPEEMRNSVKEHLLYLQEIDPDLQGYKFSKVGWLKFKRMYRNYEQWLESSQYSTSCKPSLNRYRALLYQALNLSVPGTISLQDMNAEHSVSNNIEVYENEEYLDAPVKAEPKSEDEQDLPRECLLCAKQFISISGLKAHVIAHHNYKTVRRKMNNSASPEKKKTAKMSCSTCGRNFVTHTDLMVHETCHNKSVCYACGSKFDSYGLLMRHHRRCCKKLKNCSGTPKLPENVKPSPYPRLSTFVKNQNDSSVSIRCLNCNEEFSDISYLKEHSAFHNSNNKVNDNNNRLQHNEELNSGDVNISERDKNCEQATDLDVNEQTNDFNFKEIEIKLEITNIVTLKDQLDCVHPADSLNNDNIKMEEEANGDFKIHKQLGSIEPGKTPEIEENSEKDNIVKNNEQLINETDLIDQKSFNVDDELKTIVAQEERRVDVFENCKVEISKTNEDELMDVFENCKVEISKTNEDELMVHNKNDNDLAKVMLLETDA